MPHLLVNEVFRTVQGEGVHTGVPATFVRLQGCSVGCPWCDTGHALKRSGEWKLEDDSPRVFLKEESDGYFSRCTPDILAERVCGPFTPGEPTRHVVITGGEPLEQNVGLLVELLQRAGRYVQMETSGSQPLCDPLPDWLTLSPKRGRLPVREAWLAASEVKLPIANADDLRFYEELVARELASRPAPVAAPQHAAAAVSGQRLETAPVVCVQPVSMGAEATRLCLEVCARRGWRLSLQTHKFADLR